MGVLGRRGLAVENAVAQICREGGARVSTNIFLREPGPGPCAFLHKRQATGSCGRRFVSLLDATSVSALTGVPQGTRTKQTESLCWKHASTKRGPTLSFRGERTRADGGDRRRSWRQVVGGNEGPSSGVWLAITSRSEARVLRGSVRAAWYRRWSCLLAFAAAMAVAMSLLERRGVPRAGDEPPTAHEVVAATFREV